MKYSQIKHNFRISIKSFIAYCILVTFPVQANLDNLTTHVDAIYANLSTQVETLHQSSQQLCKTTAASQQPEKLSATQLAWENAMNAWVKADLINFGLVVDENIAWRFQFWPDKKNLVKRKVEQFLQQHSDAITNKQVAEASVIIQGLSAAEYLLFEPITPSIANNKQRCQLLEEVSSVLVQNSHYLQKHWNKQPLAIKNQHDYLTLVSNALASYLEKTYKKWSLAVLKQNPYFAESWRSQHSNENIQQSLVAANSWYQQLILPYLQDTKEKKDLAKILNTAFKKNITQFKQLPNSLFSILQAIKNQEKHSAKNLLQLQETTQQFRQLKKQITLDLPKTLDVLIGFNANDGD
ncbi:imelysin family protein [Zooshikella sp. RANM57]|uniref:imelysin family protein n=1 Tax=Zooshikella sp. RANM57 TaxID=3425863 RepID=UPI003D6F7ADC